VKFKKFTEYGTAQKKFRVVASVLIVTSTALNKHHKASPCTKHLSQTNFKIYVKLDSVIYRTVTHDMNKKNSLPKQTLQGKAIWRKNHIKFTLQNVTKIIHRLPLSGDAMSS
jgi:hypothetical protein